MKTHNTKMKGKKVLSMLLALIMVLSVGSPAFSEVFGMVAKAASANASDAYATVITASDFQDGRSGNLYEETFSTLIQKAKANGVNKPDGFILGGDYEGSYAEDHDTPTAYRRVEGVIIDSYPYFNRNNIVNIQGNHDTYDASVIDETGLHEFENYLVYVINNDDQPAGTINGAKEKIKATAEELTKTFDKLVSEGETRPIFIATHVPLHHNSRPAKNGNDYKETLYGSPIFDAVNSYAKIFDIVYLFGHNHSGAFDDYIGGSVNYIGKDKKMRLPSRVLVDADGSVTGTRGTEYIVHDGEVITGTLHGEDYYTEETLNFTYMNYGYVGYSNNTNDNTLTMGAFEICPDRIVATKYSENGVYKEYTIERNMKTNSPSVTVDGYSTGKVGSAAGVVAVASGFEDPVFEWTSSNVNIAKVSYTGKAADIAYNAAGTATIKVKATEKNDSSKSAIYTYDVTVSADAGAEKGVAIYRGKDQVDGRTLHYYQADFADTVALSGEYYGLSENATTSWISSDNSVVKVNSNGLVTFVGVGEATVTYTASDNDYSDSAQVEFNVSTEKFEYKYIETDTITVGQSYVIATNYKGNKVYNDRTASYDGFNALNGMSVELQDTEGKRYLQLSDDSFEWKAVETGNANQFYLKNANSGMYLVANKEAGSSGNLGDFELVKEKPDNNDGIWQMSGGVLQTVNGLKFYPRSGGYCNVSNSSSIDSDRKTTVFEKNELEAYANIELSGEVVNKDIKTIYLAVNGRQIKLDGDYVNINQLKSETWTSSDESVATVDNKGVVTFKGVEGETVITYKATDASNNKTVTASFTLKAVLTAETTRLFKYTETVVPGRKYIIANGKENAKEGYGLAFSSFEVSYTKLLADRVDITVEDEASYIEIPESLTEVVWTPETAGGSSFYLKNAANDKYLYGNSDGTYSNDVYHTLDSDVFTSDSYATNIAQYTWTYENGSKLYNNSGYTDADSGQQLSKTYMRVRSAEFPGTSTESDSKVYFYEEIAAKPKAVITSRYEVLDKEVDRTEICPYQTEQLLPVAQNFTDNNSVNFEWSSDNPSVAKIDEDGKLTYTGKEGKVTITLTATLGDTVAKTSVVFDVIGGVGYVDPPSDTVYTENAFYKTTKLVPGRRYVLHTYYLGDSSKGYDPVDNLAVSNRNKSGQVRLLCTPIDAPQTDANGEYVVTTNDALVWECIASDVEGYVYLVNKKDDGDGTYLYMSRLIPSDSGSQKAGVAVSPSAHPDASSYSNTEETFLLKYDSETGMLTSKQLESARDDAGLGDVAHASGGYEYIRLCYEGNQETITLYEEPVVESEEPELPVYYLTNNFVDGQKYVFASSNSAGTAYAMNTSGGESTSSGYKYQKSDEITIENTSSKTFITDPSTNIIWECEAVPNETGYFYLKNAGNGKYLALLDDAANDTKNGSVVTGALNDSAIEADEFKLKVDGNKITSKKAESIPYYFYLYGDGYNRYHGKNTSVASVYLYTLEESDTPVEENVPIITEIRKQDDFGSVDITRTMQYRYDINGGDTEQLLAYIRGIKGYKTTWSTSDASIATIDENGVLTYIGKTGYVDVMLTITGKDFSGNDITRTIKTTFNISAEANKTRIAVPETVYMAPASGASTVGEIYVNNVMNANDFYNVETIAEREDNMYFGLRVVGAKSFTVSVSNATDPSTPSNNDINLYTSDGSVVSESTSFGFDSNGVFENDGGYSLRFSGAGLNPGEKATARWDITVTMNDGTTTQTYTLYTVMYAPGRTVGAVAEGRYDKAATTEISSWITGANGVNHSERSPLGSLQGGIIASGRFRVDPLANPTTLPTGGSHSTATDYIVVEENAENNYVTQTANDNTGGSFSQSYLGSLTVDQSRYSNTNQIPNLKIGFDILRVGSAEKDSVKYYTTYYTLGTESSHESTSLSDAPSGWTQSETREEIASGNEDFQLRETAIPDYSVSSINGKYIHALNKALSESMNIFDWINTNKRYANAGTSVLCIVTDKSILRERVLSAYNVTDRSTELENALQNAAAALGDPAATQTEIDKTSRELYEAMAELADKYYALKYDNLFSAFEYAQHAPSMKVASNGTDVTAYATASYLNGTITVKNNKLPTNTNEVYTEYGSDESYYLVDLKPNTEYVYEFDVTTNVKAQAFMFFYAANGAGVAPTAMQFKVNGGAWQAGDLGAPHWGVYPTEASAHYVVKFTTGENTVKGGFRFGNSSNDPVTSTFSNIKLIDSEHYYGEVQYSKTESLHKEYTLYGSLITPERPGYNFMGWKDENGSTVTSTNNATEHLTIYSQWKEVQYKVNFNGNGGKGSTTSDTLTLENNVVLPSDFTRENYTFQGWSFDDDAKVAKFSPGQEITVADVFDYIDSDNQVTLYAVWGADFCTINYSNNGAADVNVSQHNINAIKLTETITLPTPTCDYAEFVGWSFNDLQNPYDKDGVYEGGTNMKISDFPADKLDPDGNGTPVIRLHAVWKIKSNAFVDDTVISDFGVMMPVNSRENDKGIVDYHSGAEFGGTLEVGLGSVDKKTFEGKYGTFEIYKDGEGNYTQYVAYTPKKIVDTLDSEGKAILDTVTYCGQITYPDNSKSEIFKNTITVVPASNTLYEENVIKTTVETPATYQWNKKGTSTIAMQEFSSDEDVYGNDSAYANSTGFSNGTYYAATVNSTSGTDISDKATFTFVGSGFDLVSACGTETGIQVVKVSWKDSKTGKTKSKSYIVDTYFSDKALMTDADGNTSTTDDLLLYQVPIVNFRGAYNTYTVETTAAYFTFAESLKYPFEGTAPAAYSKGVITTDNGIKLETTTTGVTQDILNELDRLGFEDLGEDIEVIYMDEDSVLNQKGVLSGNMPSFFATDSSVHNKNLYSYIDGVRIYNPLNGGNGYYKDSEQSATYYNIVEELELDYDSLDKNMAYIESGSGILEFIKDQFDFDAYNEQGGPKGEIYLKEGDAIAFKFTAVTNGEDAYAMLGMRAVKGTANAKVYTAASKNDPYTKEISSATEMYYNVSPAVTVVNGEVTIIVANTGTGTLAVNNLKLVNGNLADENTIDSDGLSGSVANGNVADVPTPVVPDAGQGEGGNVEDIPETDVDTDTNIPENDSETDVEDEIEINVSTMFPGMPASIASFLEMLFKLLSQLVSSLGF